MMQQRAIVAAVFAAMCLPASSYAQGWKDLWNEAKKRVEEQQKRLERRRQELEAHLKRQAEEKARQLQSIGEAKLTESAVKITPESLVPVLPTPTPAPATPPPAPREGAAPQPPASESASVSGAPEIVVHKPPMQFLEGRTAKVVADGRLPFPAYPQVTAALEQALREGFAVENGLSDLVFSYAVVNYRQPVSAMTTQLERRMVHLSNGSFIERQVPVKYWNGTGALNLDIVVRNRQGVTLANHKTTREFQRRRIVEVNHIAAPGGSPIPSAAEIFDRLLADCVEDVANQFVKTTRRIPAELSNNRALRPGVELARVGQWDKAIALWKEAKTNDEADRALNLGAGYEALAYGAYREQGSVKEALPLLKQATDYYEQFLKTKHEWFGDRTKVLRARLESTKANFMRALENEEFTRQRLAAMPRQQGTSSPALTEKDFRQMVRNQLLTAPGPDVKAKLQQDGVELFGLSAQASAAVVSQEADKLASSQNSKERYRRYFAAAMADGRVDPAEQEVLGKLRVKLELGEGERQAVEAAFRTQAPGIDRNRQMPTVTPR